MSKKWAGFFDLDGTLSYAGGKPSEAVVETLREFRRRGNYIFLCTGRAPCYIDPWIRDIGFDGIVSGAGAHIQWGDNVIYRNYLSKEALRVIIDHYTQRETPGVLEGETHMFWIGPEDDRSPAWYQAFPHIADGDAFWREHPEQVITKLSVQRDMDADDKAVVLPLADAIVYPGAAAEIIPKGCSKSDGVRRMMEALGLPRENSIAFGDSENDIPMLAYAGIGVAMGNAVDTVKAAADRVAPSVFDDGVPVILRGIMEA